MGTSSSLLHDSSPRVLQMGRWRQILRIPAFLAHLPLDITVLVTIVINLDPPPRASGSHTILVKHILVISLDGAAHYTLISHLILKPFDRENCENSPNVLIPRTVDFLNSLDKMTIILVLPIRGGSVLIVSLQRP